jgi:hypothetical protein
MRSGRLYRRSQRHPGLHGQFKTCSLPHPSRKRSSREGPAKGSLQREARRDSRRSVHGADAGVPVKTRGSVRGRFVIRERLLQPQKGAGGRHRSRTNRSRFTATRHGERGASERVGRSDCSRKRQSLLTPQRANGREWSDGGNRTSVEMPGSAANAVRRIVNGPVPSGNV